MLEVISDSGNKTAASAHGMGSGVLAVDARAIGCLGVDRCGERFFVLTIFASLPNFAYVPNPGRPQPGTPPS